MQEFAIFRTPLVHNTNYYSYKLSTFVCALYSMYTVITYVYMMVS